MSTTTLIPGIATGLAAAFFSALSYLGTRYFTHSRTASATAMLLIISHAIMGPAAAVALLITLAAGHITLPPISHWLAQLCIVVVLYLIGHTGLLMALRNSEPSRISPMMALKLIILATLAMTFGHQPPSALQWFAIALCVTAGISLNFTGGKLHSRAILGLAIAVIFYSFSDWNARILIDLMSLPPVSAGFVAFLLTYTLAGTLMMLLLPFWGSRNPKDWLDALPFSAAWFISVAALFTCFALAGPVFGNILQSTRGIMSIALAALIARLGHLHLESLTSKSVMLRRIAAAILMTIAIALFSYEKQRLDDSRRALPPPSAARP